MAIKNLQLTPNNSRYLRCEDENDGSAHLTCVHKNALGDFEFEQSILVPPQQRENLANFLLSTPLCPQNSSPATK
jgi:hypothetical protein